MVAPPNLPQCRQVPDVLHRNADLIRLRNAHREALAYRDRSNAIVENDRAAEAVYKDLALDGTLPGWPW